MDEGVRRYVYVSARKLAVQAPQVVPERARSGPDPAPGSVDALALLADVEAGLRRTRAVRTLQDPLEPGDWFDVADVPLAHAVPADVFPGQAAVFAGATDTTRLLLCGATKHLLVPAADPVEVGGTPEQLAAVTALVWEATTRGEHPDGTGAGLSALDAFDHLAAALGRSAQPVVALARVNHVYPAPVDGAPRVVAGTPLFVALPG